ncbi:MAG TPA: GNAT family protein [Candidatus Dormibacteraeota bacterium]
MLNLPTSLPSGYPDPDTGLLVGAEVDPAPGRPPELVTLHGREVDLVPLDRAAHGPALWEELRDQSRHALWRYLPDGPFPDEAAFDAFLGDLTSRADVHFYAILDRASQRALGWASLMRVEPRHRCLEVGYILYTPALQRTRGATEAMWLLARYVFEELGYRRYEWKCDALNAPSRRAALRLGFTFEGVFRQHLIVKGRNRDTAWYSILDHEWPARRARLERWLDQDNFDPDGQQLVALSTLTPGTEPGS